MNRIIKALWAAGTYVWLSGAAACGNTHVQSQRVPHDPHSVVRDTVRPGSMSDTEIGMLGGPANASGARLGDLQHIVYEFGVEQGRLPATLEEAIAAERRRSSHLGADFTSLRQDLWGREVRYTHRVTMFELRSAGEDAEFGTPDDILVIGQQGREKPCFARVGTREVRFPEGTPPCMSDFGGTETTI